MIARNIGCGYVMKSPLKCIFRMSGLLIGVVSGSIFRRNFDQRFESFSEVENCPTHSLKIRQRTAIQSHISRQRTEHNHGLGKTSYIVPLLYCAQQNDRFDRSDSAESVLDL